MPYESIDRFTSQISLITFQSRLDRTHGPIPFSAAAKNTITFPIMHRNASHALGLTLNAYTRKLRECAHAAMLSRFHSAEEHHGRNVIASQ